MADCSDSDSSSEDTGCPPSKRKSLADKTKFSTAWTKEFTFISSVKGDPYK